MHVYACSAYRVCFLQCYQLFVEIKLISNEVYLRTHRRSKSRGQWEKETVDRRYIAKRTDRRVLQDLVCLQHGRLAACCHAGRLTEDSDIDDAARSIHWQHSRRTGDGRRPPQRSG